METELKVLETGFDELGLLVLDENEAMETDGGGHWELIDNEYTWVND